MVKHGPFWDSRDAGVWPEVLLMKLLFIDWITPKYFSYLRVLGDSGLTIFQLIFSNIEYALFSIQIT
jgi:hypothetical protein